MLNYFTFIHYLIWLINKGGHLFLPYDENIPDVRNLYAIHRRLITESTKFRPDSPQWP